MCFSVTQQHVNENRMGPATCRAPNLTNNCTRFQSVRGNLQQKGSERQQTNDGTRVHSVRGRPMRCGAGPTWSAGEFARREKESMRRAGGKSDDQQSAATSNNQQLVRTSRPWPGVTDRGEELYLEEGGAIQESLRRAEDKRPRVAG